MQNATKTKDILANAQAEGQLWLEAFKPTQKADVARVREELQKLYPECLVKVVASPLQAPAALKEGVGECLETTDETVILAKLRELQPQNCIWDYYFMAFYECACGQLEDEPEFTKRSLFPAFEAGLGFLVNLGAPPVDGIGGLLVGVCRPIAYRDDQLRLHREDGPAIIYEDFEEFWFRGVQVDRSWIMEKASLDPELFLSETNTERRRVLAELIGWDRIVTQLGFRVVHQDSWGELLRVENPLGDTAVEHSLFVRVRCPSTRRIYVHRIRPDVKTAHEGVASMWSVGTDEFAPGQQS